jgi:hypothetical protein
MEGKPKKPSYEQAWSILMEVSEHLHEEEDAKGDLKPTGEAAGLNRMKKALEREISKDATDFLKEHGFNGWGLKARPKKGKRK